jgi:aryl-alcohol dehydrogenase-like predicted oxidoreductase
MLDRATLPQTDLKVSRLSLGTAHFGLKNTEEEVHRLLDRYVSLGGNFIDTARIYSDWVPGENGRCERIIGDWLRDNPGVRDKMVIGTKGLHFEWNNQSVNRVTYEGARHDIEKSLEVLGINTIDLYYLHRDSPTLGVEEIVDFLQVFIKEGKVRYLAVANWKEERIAAANAYAEREGKHGFVANQPLFSLGSWNIKPPPDTTMTHLTKAEYDYHKKNLALVPYSSQSQGFFTKAAGETEFDQSEFKNSRFYSESNLKLAEVVKELAANKGCNANGISIAYLLGQPFPIFPIVGCNQSAQLEDSIRAATVTLTRDELQALENAAGSGIEH